MSTKPTNPSTPEEYRAAIKEAYFLQFIPCRKTQSQAVCEALEELGFKIEDSFGPTYFNPDDIGYEIGHGKFWPTHLESLPNGCRVLTVKQLGVDRQEYRRLRFDQQS